MTAPIKTCDYCCAVGVMPTFMDGETVCYDCLPTLPKTMREARREVVLLRAKVEQMERQEPVGKFIQHPSHGMWEQDGYSDNPDARPLYALPGAQPAPGVPGGWQLVPIEPTNEMLRAIRVQRSGARKGKGDRADWKAWLAAAPKPEE